MKFKEGDRVERNGVFGVVVGCKFKQQNKYSVAVFGRYPEFYSVLFDSGFLLKFCLGNWLVSTDK